MSLLGHQEQDIEPSVTCLIYSLYKCPRKEEEDV